MSVVAPPKVAPRLPHGPVSSAGDFGPGRGEGWSLLVVARNQVVAHLIGGLLSEEGIEFTFDTTNTAPGAWLHPFGDPAAPVRVLVRKLDLGIARALIAETDRGAAPAQESTRSSRSWNVRLTLVVILAIVLMLAFVEVVGFAPCFLRLFCF